MGYRIQHNQYISLLTGKKYPFNSKGVHGRENKAAALRQMEADDAKVRAAGEQRHGRELSLREQLRGVPEPDTRTIRERIADEVQHSKRPDEPANPYSARIAELEKQHRYSGNAKDRAKIERRIAELKTASDAHDTKIAEQRAFESLMASAEVQQHIKHAETYLERLLLDPNTPQSEIVAARQRLQRIKTTGDVGTYRDEYNAAQARATDALSQRRADLEAELDKVRAEFGFETGVGEATNSLTESTALGGSEVEV